jgi:L-amino acid N-acyltransferase YncA
MEQLEFIRIREEHVQEVMEIYNYFVLNSTATFHLEALNWEEMKASVMNKNPRYPTFVIQKEGVITGYILITQHKNKQAYDATGEVTIYLKPEYGGQGIGGKALAFVEQFAKEHKYHVLIATISGENEQSAFLFKKNGYTQAAHFKEIGLKFGRRVDILSFQKILD